MLGIDDDRLWESVYQERDKWIEKAKASSTPIANHNLI